MGAGGFGVDQVLLKYRYYGKDFNPDLVITGLYIGMFLRASVGFNTYLKPYFVFNQQTQSMEMKNRSGKSPASLRGRPLIFKPSPLPAPQPIMRAARSADSGKSGRCSFLPNPTCI